MEILIKETGQSVTEQEFRRLYPNTSFPNPIPESVINEFGGDIVFEGAQPIATEYQYVVRQGIEQVDGKWYTKFVLVDYDQTGIDNINNQKAEFNKKEAARLLTESDFYDLPNTASKIQNINEILTYRDQLRAIALNPTYNAVFPTKPDTIWI